MLFHSHVLQNPTDSTELDSSSSLAPFTENDPITFTSTNRKKRMESDFVATDDCRFSDAHLARGGVYEFGVTVHRTRQHQSSVLVTCQAGKRPLVAVLT